LSYKKKLIEVALPLPEVNDASAYDKMPGIGPHPKGIHHWWARLPLPTSRAVLFASLVDDPSEHPEKWPSEAAQNAERERLFDVVRRMMGKRLHEHPEVYAEARTEMLKYCDDRLPSVFDPFAGGGSIPLEANRLGFDAYAGDINPVAVLLNKCNLELAPRWFERSPVNPEDRKQIGGTGAWHGTHGLAADVRYYGRLVRDRARQKIGHVYPKVRLPKEYGRSEANVIAWIWARTVASPDPAARRRHVPLMSTYWLCSKKGGEAWLEPVVDRARGSWSFQIRIGAPMDRNAVKAGTKTGRAQFRCLLTDAPISDEYIKAQGKAGGLGTWLVAVVAEGTRGRLYLPVTDSQIPVMEAVDPPDELGELLAEDPRNIWCTGYGLTRFYDLFTARQVAALVTLSDLVRAIGPDVRRDAAAADLSADDADAYACTVTTFLALAVDRCADFNNALCRWSASNQKVMNLFGRQAIPMVWDFAEANLLGDSVGAWSTCSEYVGDCIEVISPRSGKQGSARQIDAATGADGIRNLLVSTDPPYYDNIGYAGLSDFFYVWLRRALGKLYPDLFSTVLVPKMPELTAAPERFDGDKQRAKEHFETGFRKAFTALREKMDPRFPLSVYYAFKQADEEVGDEDEGEATAGVDLTTGWETLLEALIASGFQITATWPVRASQAWRMRAMGANALASYIVLACRPRPTDAPQTDRRSFVTELKRELPSALRRLQQGNIAPVDFAQAAIGPGMAIYSRYGRILESSGSTMAVRTALALINQTLTEVLSEQADEFDADTRWTIAWFEQQGMSEGSFGDADVLARAKNTSVQGLEDAGVLSARGGSVRLLSRAEYDGDWDPAEDRRLAIWECTQHLIVQLDMHGEEGAAVLCARLGGGRSEAARALAYRLYAICERKGWAQEALAYNSLVVSWPAVQERAARLAATGRQSELFK
jgi:putative DNA methylase